MNESAPLRFAVRLFILIAVASVAARVLEVAAVSAGFTFANAFGQLVQPLLTVAMLFALLHLCAIAPLVFRLRSSQAEIRRLGSRRRDLEEQLATFQADVSALRAGLDAVRAEEQAGRDKQPVGARPHDERSTQVTEAVPEQVVVMQREIVQLREAASALRETENRFRRLAESSEDGLWTLDASGITTFVNRPAAALLGGHVADILGRSAHDYLVVDDLPAELRKLDLSGGSAPDPVEFRVRRRDRKEQWVRAALCSILSDEGDYLGVLILMQRRSQGVQVENNDSQRAGVIRDQRLESAANTTRGLAHQLNSVLAPIPLAVHLLRPQLEKQSQELLGTIEATFKTGADFLREALIFAGVGGAERVRVKLLPVLRGLASSIRDLLPSEVEVTSHLPADLWEVEGNLPQIREVLLKLCVSARDAMPAGGHFGLRAKNVRFQEAYANASPRLPGGPYVKVEVSDTGVPISPSLQPHIFEPFVTSFERTRTSGLRLATVFGMVRNLGGAVEVESAKGSGTVFAVYWRALPR